MSDKSNMQPNWHPNFRIGATLPDTRAIRTNCIVKVILYSAIVVAVLFVLQGEYQAYTLRQSIKGLEQQIEKAASVNRSSLKKSEQFRKLALNVKELQQFFRAPLVAHEAIVELALIKPEMLTFTRLTLSESVIQVKNGRNTMSQVAFNLSISGNVQDLPVLTQFKRELEKSKLLNPIGYTTSIEETIQQRDAETGIIPFQLSILLKSAKDKTTSERSAP